MKIRIWDSYNGTQNINVEDVKLTTLEKVVIGGLCASTVISTIGTIGMFVYLIKEYDT